MAGTNNIQDLATNNSRDNNAAAGIDPTSTTASSRTAPSRLRTHARGLAFSVFSNIGRSLRRKTNAPQETESTSVEELFHLDEDTYSLMMISRPCSREWLLGMVTFLIFQLWLELLILFNLLFKEDLTILYHGLDAYNYFWVYTIQRPIQSITGSDSCARHCPNTCLGYTKRHPDVNTRNNHSAEKRQQCSMG